MAYKFNTDIIFGDDVKIEGDLEIGHCIIGYPTRTEVKNLINNMGHLKREIVTSLPDNNIDPDTIYMVKKEDTTILTLGTWYGGMDRNGNWGIEPSATIGNWIECQVYADTTYKINPIITKEVNYYITEKKHSGIPIETITINNSGEFTPSKTGALMIGPFADEDFPYDYLNKVWSLTITAYLRDAYKEYMYINGAWTQTGDTSTDLSNFATLEEIGDINKALNEIATTLGIWSTMTGGEST